MLLREPEQHSLNTSSETTIVTESGEVFFDTCASTASLTKELPYLLAASLKVIQSFGRERACLHEQLKSRELELECAHEQRQVESEQAGIREEQDKEYILTVENNYQHELLKLRLEKDEIVLQSRDFALNLQALTQEYEDRAGQVREL